MAASGTLLLALLASLAGQSGTAAAATAPPVATTAAPATAQPKAEGPQAAPEPDRKAAREAAQKASVQALQATGVSGTCPAALAPHTVVGCTLEANRTASFSLTLPQQKDVVLLEISGQTVHKLVAPGGAAVACESVYGAAEKYPPFQCPVSQAGTYTLEVKSSDGSQTDIGVSYVPLLSSTSCRAVGAADHKLGAPTVLHGSLSASSAGACFTLDLASGDVLRGHVVSDGSPWPPLRLVHDATGKQVCTSLNQRHAPNDCKLTGTAPFRASLVDGDGAYDLTLAKLSRPEGCTVVEPQAYGASPEPGSSRCRTLRVPQAGDYTIAPAFSGANLPGSLYLQDGTPSNCWYRNGPCALAPGDYTWAVNGDVVDAGAFAVAFHSAKETRGCTPGNDNGLVAGASTGTFSGAGQEFCLTLPTSTGKGLYLLNRPPAGGTDVVAVVYDASGAQQCKVEGYLNPVCRLTGTAPFRAVLTGAPAKAYGLVVHRTGEAAGCAPWRQTGFDSTSGAKVSVSDTVRQACLSVPADQHSTVEMIGQAALSTGTVTTVHLTDPSGAVCASDTCVLSAGVPYTAMVVGHRAETYELARRDVSPTATCAAPASTKVGGPSLSFDLTSALDARCVRVGAATTDKLWFGARTPVDRYTPAATTVTAVDAAGRIACRQEQGPSCRASGSASYVAVVTVARYQGKPLRAYVDSWKVGTAAGWAPECTADRVSDDPSIVRSGVLTEQSTARCSVVAMKPSHSFGLSLPTTAGDLREDNGPVDVSLHNGPGWTRSAAESGYGCPDVCSASSSAAPGDAVLLLTAGKAATPVEYSMQGACSAGCKSLPGSWISGISPATGPAGTRNQAVVHGTGLRLGTELRLMPSDDPFNDGTALKPLSVSPDGTSMKVLVDTNGLKPGLYDVGPYIGGHRITKAYTVTAPAPVQAGSRFVPAGPSRFLDTRDGTGAKKERVGPGGVVTLQVAGVKGIPASGVTAVVMNVTAVHPTEAGHVMVYPNGQPTPKVSNLNFAPGQIVPNLVTVPVVNGKVDLRNNAGSVDLIADVTGYYTDKAGDGSALNSITPSRFLDTRDGTGAKKERAGPGGVVTLQVAGVKGIPASGVTAVVMNVTAVYPTQAGHVTVYPNGQAAPDVSNLNFTAGQIVPNLVTVPVVNGKVDLRNNAGSVDLIADVTGYYAATGSSFSAAGPVRLLDTRDGSGARTGAVGPGGLVSLQVAGVEGVPAQGVTAVVLNVTVTNPTEAGHLIVHPHGVTRPNVSNLNYTAGQTVANLVVVPVVDGRVTFFNNSGSLDVIADLSGYFTS
ncbi:hypothetical protein PV721_17505 [Streptomyces sp. MB09-01]|uniref:hypothetical protein n=1 Tax=Streptomyces sp. MB09-01 TaxID=3028666 RepID=UPI0029A1DD77|nr:hypothetical protein [Streptomyces sp. MB09-01]MDX3536137.1 hypothetical protein [Streptomyces sp. MB09-01]